MQSTIGRWSYKWFVMYPISVGLLQHVSNADARDAEAKLQPDADDKKT